MSVVRVSIGDGRTAADLVRYFERIPEEAEAAVRAVVQATALKVEGTAKERIQRGPKTGRVYPRGKGRVHRASAPGESPATDTGTLASRIYSELRASGHEATVYGAVSYAGYLEFGTSRMAPRPYLAPALETHAEEFVRDIEDAVAGRLELG